MDTREAVEAYLLECRARRLSERTIEGYKWALDKFVAACPTIPESIEPFTRFQVSQDFPSSESHYDLWRSLRTFYKWAARRYDIPDVMVDVPSPERDATFPRTLEAGEIKHLLASTVDPRDFAMLLLVLDTGMRLGDVANLRWPHVRGNRLLLVRGKGRKQRHVFIRPETKTALQDLGDGYHIWLSQRPGRRFNAPLGQHGVQQAIKRALRRAGFHPPKAGPHMLRHTYGRHFIKNGGSLPQLQRILGHSHIKSTQIYVNLNDGDLEQPQHEFSPIAGLVLMPDNEEGA